MRMKKENRRLLPPVIAPCFLLSDRITSLSCWFASWLPWQFSQTQFSAWSGDFFADIGAFRVNDSIILVNNIGIFIAVMHICRYGRIIRADFTVSIYLDMIFIPAMRFIVFLRPTSIGVLLDEVVRIFLPCIGRFPVPDQLFLSRLLRWRGAFTKVASTMVPVEWWYLWMQACHYTSYIAKGHGSCRFASVYRGKARSFLRPAHILPRIRWTAENSSGR